MRHQRHRLVSSIKNSHQGQTLRTNILIYRKSLMGSPKATQMFDFSHSRFRFAFEASRWLQDGPRRPQERPKRGPRRPQERQRAPQERSKRAPRGDLRRYRRAMLINPPSLIGVLQDCPSTASKAPKNPRSPEDSPNGFTNCQKKAPRWLQEARNILPERLGPTIFVEPTTSKIALTAHPRPPQSHK